MDNSSRETLKEMNTMLQSLLHAIPDIIVFKDAHLRHRLVNRATEEFTGLSGREMVGRSIEDLVHHELAEQCRSSDEEALRSGRPMRFEESFSTGDGSRRVLDTIKAPMYDETGCLLGLVAVSRDITGLKKTEEALLQSEAYIRDILNSVDQGFIVVDRDFRIVSANRAYLQQVEKHLEEVVGRCCHEVTHHSERPCFELGERCAVRLAFETEAPSYAMHIHNGGGRERMHAETRAYPLRDRTGVVVAAIETITNVTERTKLEDQLRHFQRLEAVGRIATGVAHDFNNIILSVVGFAQMMLRQLTPEDAFRPYLEQILKAMDRGTTITQSLLSFSRKQVMHLRPMNLNEAVRRIEPFLLRLVREDIDLRMLCSAGEMRVSADSGQIDQVLMNLVTNARDALPEGGRITIATDRVVMDQDFITAHGYGKMGDYALLSIADTGQGMDDRVKEKIFEPFYTTKPEGQGTGLGLSMVYGIVKQHDGFIGVYSEPGQGTVFAIYLPLLQ